ncbi:MAG: molybdenum cofactor guanylyltransferase, partial [Acidobacteria bacterium]|nr:molybdenum cofactor guanylyltransferase [Acidobacteriota bacterium]
RESAGADGTVRGASAYILVGGRSRRMGTDKALLKRGGVRVLDAIAAELAAVASPVTLVGDPRRYGAMGLACIPDRWPGLGPAAAIATALAHSQQDWNLVVACDLPAVSRHLFAALLDCARRANADAIVPATPEGRLHPLCAVYHRRALAAFEAAVAEGRFAVHDVLARLETGRFEPPHPEALRNVNTPEQWTSYLKHGRD